MTATFAERRSDARRAFRKSVLVKVASGRSSGTVGRTDNVSGSGMLLLLPAPLAVHSDVELLFDMPTVVGGNFYPVLCKGTVVRVEPAGEQFGIAVALKNLDNIGTA